MTDPCSKVNAFFDGELSPAEAEAFRAHLGTCDDCARALAALTELEGIVSAHREEVLEKIQKEEPVSAPREKAPVVPIQRAARWRIAVPAVATLVAVAAAVWLVIGKHAAVPTPEAPLALLDTPTRSLEARLSYGPADKYRPYDVQRSADATRGEHVSLEALAQLEKTKAYTGLAAGLLLSGDRSRAREALDHAGKSVDADVERAALAYEQGKLEDALNLLDPILEKDPKNGAAQWNMGLVLRDMHLDLLAAAAFEKVAALGEQGWADEATVRAKAIRQEWDEKVTDWRAAKAAGMAMVATGAIPAPAFVRRYPSYMTRFLYHAMRASPTRAEVLALLPLAKDLDGNEAGGFRVRAVQRMAAGNFARRAPLATEYRARFPGWVADRWDNEDVAKFIARVRRAGETDIAFGISEMTNRTGLDANELLATAPKDDPWLTLSAQLASGNARLASADYSAAESTLRNALAACDAHRLDYLCARIELQLVTVYDVLSRFSDAAPLLRSGLTRSRATAHDVEYYLEIASAEVARGRNDVPVMKAWLADMLARYPETCATRRIVHEYLAEARRDALDPVGARAEIEQSPECGEPVRLARVDIISSLALFGMSSPDPRLSEEVAEARSSWPANSVFIADVALAGALLQTDRVRGEAALRSAIAAANAVMPSDSPDVKTALVWGHLFLGLDAARANRSASAFEELVAASGAAAADATCSLAVGVVYQRSFAVANDVKGSATIYVDEDRKSPELDPLRILPPAIRASLAGCDPVRVFAPPPVHGTPRLLGDDVAWSYRLGSGRADRGPPVPTRLVVSGVEPPPSIELPHLAPWMPPQGEAGETTRWLHGPAATPSQVLSAMLDATEIEIHAHGLVDLSASDASLLVLSPEASGRYALTASDIQSVHLKGEPIVVLAACTAAHVAPLEHEPWSLPLAFIRAGARAVIASPAPVDDAGAAPFFDAVLSRIRDGADPAVAVRDERVRALSRGAGPWVRDVLVFN